MLIDYVHTRMLAEGLGIEPRSTWNILDSTKASSYMACPRKFFYEQVLGWKPEYPSNHLIFGSSFHLALEHLLLNGYTQESVAKAYDIFCDDYRKTYGPETDELFEPKTPENTFYVLVQYARTWCSDLDNYDVLYTEIGGSAAIASDRVIHFKMDSILRNKHTGKVISLDHKTASSFYNWSDQFTLAIQTGTYHHTLMCLFPEEEVAGVVYNGVMIGKAKKAWADIKAGKSLTTQSPIDFLRVPAYKSKEQMRVWLWLINDIYTSITRDYESLATQGASGKVMQSFPMRPGSCTNYGKLCEYHDFCASWTNPAQRASVVPIGFILDHWDPTAEPVKTKFDL